MSNLTAARRVQGMASTFDDVVLKGQQWAADVSGRVIAAELDRTIEGASTLIIEVHDPEGKLRSSRLLKSRFDVQVDGLWFRFVAASKTGNVVKLTFEDREVARLRLIKGPAKAYRDQVTRAEFILSRVREAKPKIPFFSPSLHVEQPIENEAQGKANQKTKNERRAPGLDAGAPVTVKGVKASSSQIQNIDRVLDVGVSLSAPEPVLIAAVMTITQETNAENLSVRYVDGNYFGGLFMQNPDWSDRPQTDIEAAATAFYKSSASYPGGTIGYYKDHPGTALGAMCQAIQRSAHPTLYDQHEAEARRTVKEYLGGASAGTGSTSVEVEQRYAFEQKKDEDVWTMAGRLTEEVRWRRFVSAGVMHVLPETDLLKSKVRLRINDDSPGVDSIDWDWDMGKRVSEATVTGRLKAWAAPPGTVVVLTDQGPADGRYIVSSIRRPSLFTEAAEITLKRPTPPLPEPAAETRTKTIEGRSTRTTSRGGSSDLVDWARSTLGTNEGSAQHQEWAGSLGLSTALPWCSIWVAYGIRTVLDLPLPSAPAYSGAWLSWSSGTRVSASNLQPGDIVVFDWGDGGITDHVAIYIGGGRVIGGNQSNSVTEVPLSSSALVGAVRPG